MSRAVFLDRDGVINEIVMRDGKPASPRTLDEFALCAGIDEPLRRLVDAGFRLFAVSNQPDVARGLLEAEVVAQMADRVRATLPVEAVHTCPHDDSDLCPCRKPRPGLFREIAEQQQIALAASYVIGDGWKDVQAGSRAGCRTILLQRPYNDGITADHVVGDVAAAADLILSDVPADRADLHVTEYLREVRAIAEALDAATVVRLVDELVALRARRGRLFLLGVGGSAANASHAANDFRKICGIEAYCATDNVAELTARVNDDGWDTAYSAWLKGSRVSGRDAVLIMSVGGGSAERGVSNSLVQAIDAARQAGATVLGIVGRDGGYTARVADECIVVPPVNPSRVTPHTEAFQAVVWHMLVSHPALCAHEMTWEGLQRKGAADESK